MSMNPTGYWLVEHSASSAVWLRPLLSDLPARCTGKSTHWMFEPPVRFVEEYREQRKRFLKHQWDEASIEYRTPQLQYLRHAGYSSLRNSL